MEQNWRPGLAQIVNRMNMLYLETETQNASNGALPTSSSGTNSVAPGDSLQQVGMDQADILWSKMQTLKEKYLQDMKELYNVLANKSQQHMSEDKLQMLTHYKDVLQRMMPYLTAAKGSLPKEFEQDFEAFEKQIVSIMETYKRRKQAQQQQPQQVGQPGGMDQADIVWSKMQTLKEKYLQDMKELYNVLANKSQQHMSEDKLQMLTHYKDVLQRMMPYLTAAKGSLPKEFEQDFEAFEKQIVSIMETYKRRKQAQQQQPQQQGNLGQVQAVQLMDK